MKVKWVIFFLVLLTASTGWTMGNKSKSDDVNKMWPEKKAWDWYNQQPWLVGCNYVPSTASNQFEMWQAETFDPETIDRELKWASEIGFNIVRIFLHDMMWEQDSKGFVKRIDTFLEIADKHNRLPDRHAEEILPADRLLVRILESLFSHHANGPAACL